ncbi:MAG: TIGR04372 family glycosyltransferase, partial [Candidatus Omnitrophica bacterium]|nr:TIGR04372 family glycosyltransferase [Candidatus Omnitrophota bacterium]
KKCLGILFLILSIPLVLIIRFLRPFCLIRFGVLPSNRIGHFAANTEIYLCERDKGSNYPKKIDIFYYNGEISNYQLKKMWDRTLRIWFLGKWVDKANRLFLGYQANVVPINCDIDSSGFLRQTKPHLSFISDEEYLGQAELRKMGLPVGNPFICFIARDKEYLKSTQPDIDWGYHNYRDADINNYIPAMEELTPRGYFALRMGAMVGKKINISNPNIIDYASNGRSDFLDVYLSAKCDFFVCDTAGVSSLPIVFRRPIAWVNYIPLKLAPIGSLDDLFIPKKLWLLREERFLTFSEIFNSEIGGFTRNFQYEQQGIKVVENTPEEIRGLVIEMEERIKGQCQRNTEDKRLQERFWTLFKSDSINNKSFPARVGADFLRKNKELLK